MTRLPLSGVLALVLAAGLPAAIMAQTANASGNASTHGETSAGASADLGNSGGVKANGGISAATIDNRIGALQDKADDAKAAGQITKQEATNDGRRLDRTAHRLSVDDMRNGGSLTANQSMQLNHQLNVTGMQISRQRGR